MKIELLIKKCQHMSNPLHIYCRLRKVMWKRLAIMIAYFYEKTFFNTILHKLIAAEIRHIERKKERKQINENSYENYDLDKMVLHQKDKMEEVRYSFKTEEGGD